MRSVQTSNYQNLPIFDLITQLQQTPDQIPVSPTHRKLKKKALPKQARLVSNRHSPFPFLDNLEVTAGSRGIQNNLTILKSLPLIRRDPNPPTVEIKKLLATYTGFGHCVSVFDCRNPWYTNFRGILTPPEYQAIQASAPFAYYTPLWLIRAIWDLVGKLGFTGGRILEPACGIGHFIGTMPGTIYHDSAITAVENDPLAAEIAHLLYPDIALHATGYEDTKFAKNSFDLILTNVPFGDAPVFDPAFDSAYTKAIHDYYFIKSLDLVRPGGLIAFLTSRFTLDKKDATIREYIAERADLVAAYRLPNNTFPGTEAVADLIVLQKRSTPLTGPYPAWVYVDKRIVNGQYSKGLEAEINRYFLENPDQVLGVFDAVSSQHGPKLTVQAHPSKEQIVQRIATVAEKLYTPIEIEEEEQPTEYDLAPEDTKDGEFFVGQVDDLLYRNIGGFAVPQNKTAKVEAKIRLLIEIARQAQIVLKSSADASDFVFKGHQAALLRSYQTFVKQHGYLNEKDNVRTFAEDVRAPLVRALENYNAQTKTGEPTPIFYKRTVGAVQYPDRVENTADALTLSLARFGEIRLGYISDLVGRSEREVAEKLQGRIYFDPALDRWQTADQYLSGNIAEKIAAVQGSTQYSENLQALQSAMPKRIEPEEIIVNLGATWIPKEIFERFIDELCDQTSLVNNLLDPHHHYEYDVRSWLQAKLTYTAPLNQWSIDRYSCDSYVLRGQTWGTRRMGMQDLLDHVFNSREPTIWDDDGRGKRTINQAETAAAREKAHLINNAFRQWLWRDEQRRSQLADLYNKKFNVFVIPKISGEHLNFPGMSDGITLKPHQKNVVWRGLQGGNLLFWHIVGAGKTFEMVTLAMEARRMGVRSKPMHVVPNHLLEQYTLEFYRLYPAANLLVIDSEGLSPQNLQTSLARIATGDYDSIILTQASCARIPLSDALWASFIDLEIDQIRDLIEELKAERDSSKQSVIKRLELRRRKLEADVKKRVEGAKKKAKGGITWEQLGIDLLLVDECQAYKGLGFVTNLNVPGVGSSDSAIAYDMFVKTQWLTRRCTKGHLLGERRSCYCGAEQASGQLIFATGTALTNTVCEMYTLQRFLQMDTLADLGLLNFDAWAKQFGDTETVIEMKPSGKGWRSNTRFVKFNNVPELWSIFAQNCDPQLDADTLQLDRPKMIDGKPIAVECQPTQEMIAFIDQCAIRAEKYDPRNPEKDNILKIMSDAMKAATDMRLVDYQAEDHPDSKINQVAQKVYEIWQEAQRLGVLRTQMIFLDIGTPGGSTFNLYQDMKDKWVALGVPAREIVFAHDGKTDQERKQIFDRVNRGEAKIIVGSTGKMGTGTNAQKYLYALHHVDVPWTPGLIEQREGRILRQGNTHPEVYIFRYVTARSMDFYRWHLNVLKAGFIHQLVKGNVTQRTVQDLESTVISFAQMKALATGNPLVLEQVRIEAEVTRLSLLHQQWYDNQRRLQYEVASLPKTISDYQEKIAIHQQAEAILQAEPDRTLKIGKTIYQEEKKANAAVEQAVEMVSSNGQEIPIHFGPIKAILLGRKVFAEEKEYRVWAKVIVGGVEGTIDLVKAGHANINRILGEADRIPGDIHFYTNQLRRTEEQFQQTQLALQNDLFPHAESLQQALERMKEIDAEISALASGSASTQAVAMVTEEEEPSGETITS